MIPDRIGIIGNTHGVNDSSKPNPKKLATTTQKLSDLKMPATLEESDSGAALPALDMSVLADTTGADSAGARCSVCAGCAVAAALSPLNAMSSRLNDFFIGG